LVTYHILIFNTVVKYSLQMQQRHFWRNFSAQTWLFFASPQICCYTTLWKVNVRKSLYTVR